MRRLPRGADAAENPFGFSAYRRLPIFSARFLSRARRLAIARRSGLCFLPFARSASIARSWSSPSTSDSTCASAASSFIIAGQADRRIEAEYQRSFTRLRHSWRFSVVGFLRAVR